MTTVAGFRDDLRRSLADGPLGADAAVVVLLDFEPVRGHPSFGQYISGSGIDWDRALKDRAWTISEAFLIATAASLCTGSPHGADVFRVPFLPDSFYDVWQAMVTASRTGVVPPAGE